MIDVEWFDREGGRQSLRLVGLLSVFGFVRGLPPADLYLEHEELHVNSRIHLKPSVIDAIKLGTVVASTLEVVGPASLRRIAGWSTVGGMCLLSRHSARVLMGFAPYDAHRVILYAASVEAEASAASCNFIRYAAWVKFIEDYIALSYSQAGLSKAVHGRRSWWTAPVSLHNAFTYLGTSRARAIAGRPRVMKWVSRATVIGEVSVYPISRWPAARPILGFVTIGFHLASMSLLRISFWHLWIYSIAITLVPCLQRWLRRSRHARIHG